MLGITTLFGREACKAIFTDNLTQPAKLYPYSREFFAFLGCLVVNKIAWLIHLHRLRMELQAILQVVISYCGNAVGPVAYKDDCEGES